MFTEIPGGTCEEIQGLQCWIPPIGEIYDPIKGHNVKVSIIRRSNVFEDCFWEPDPRWKKFPIWEAEEAAMHGPIIKRNAKLLPDQKPEPLPAHSELAKFRRDMWQLRLGGCWYYNNNVPTYITGQHWYYLSVYQGFFRTPNNLPKYRNVDRQYFYFWQYCWENPKCYGMIETRKRQDGKSYRAGSIALEMTSRTQFFHAGIQSKTDDDAAAFFEKCILNPFRKLPSFFVAKSNLEGKKSTVKELKFISNSARSSQEQELESKVSYKASVIKAYDGQPLGLYIGDEEGKTKQISVYDRWNIVRYCLRNEEGVKTGCSIHTSTVEASEEGGGSFAKMWHDSNQYNRVNGKTTGTGLFKFFISAALTRNVDRYGFADEALSVKEITEEREVLDDRALSQAKRREPLNEKEAFSIDSTRCKYNPITLSNRFDELTAMGKAYKTCDLIWKDGIVDGEVMCIPNPTNGRFMIMWEPPEERRNLKITKESSQGDYYFPAAKYQGAGGCDPYDHQLLAEGGEYTMSMGALVIMKKSYLMDDSAVEGGPALVYNYRPDSPVELYEDFIKAAHYYGVQILIETNKPGCDQHFKDRGYGGYSYQLPDKKKSGIAAGAQSKGGGTAGQITDVTEQFIFESLNTVFYPQLIDQWIRWDPMETTKYDLAVAFGYAVMLMNQSLTVEKRKKTKKMLSVKEYMPFARRKQRSFY